MARRFIVGTDELTSEQKIAYKTYLNTAEASWWHWLQGMWLVIDWTEALSASVLRDELRKAAPEVHCLVLEVSEDIDWAGIGPSSENQDFFEWLKTTWKN